MQWSAEEEDGVRGGTGKGGREAADLVHVERKRGGLLKLAPEDQLEELHPDGLEERHEGDVMQGKGCLCVLVLGRRGLARRGHGAGRWKEERVCFCRYARPRQWHDEPTVVAAFLLAVKLHVVLLNDSSWSRVLHALQF